jgi:microcystin-dependent protein
MLITNLTSQDYWFGPLHLQAGNGQTLTVDDTSATSLYLTDDGVADAINTLYTASPPKITVTGAAAPFPRATGEPTILHGDGSPEGLIYAGQGSVYLRRDNTGGAQFYQKTTGIHVNTGWVSFAGSVVTTPTGALHMYGGAAAPIGWLMCDGAAVSRATYADLFAVIGTAYGAGDGSTTFNIPDCQGRTLVGKGTPLDVSALGNSDGLSVGQRRPQHRHTPHTHSPSTGVYIVGTAQSGAAGGGPIQGGLNQDATTGPKDGGSGNANDSLDAPAYLVVNYIIKT